MIDDAFVIDAVVHGYNFSPENREHPVSEQLAPMFYGMQWGFSPRGQQQWILDFDRFTHGADPDLLAGALFAESQTDMAIYHGIPLWGLAKDGGSPLWVGKQMRERWPGRVALYGPVSPFHHDVVNEVDRLVEEDGVVGIKLYPVGVVDGEFVGYRMDDPEMAFPIFERARQRGVRNVAIHKAMPTGPVPIDPFKVADLERALVAFPDLTFEIVHGGFAFLEETALLVARFPNAIINLEGVSAFLPNAPMKFAEILGSLLASGAHERIVWATGCFMLHPRPLVEAFWNFEMPEQLVEGYGFPPLTREVKQAILGGNIARILGLDIEALRRETAQDEFANRTNLAEPWSWSRVLT